MYKYQDSGIFVMKVESHLDILTCSVLLKSFFGDLGKQYKLPTPLKRHMSGLALQGLIRFGLFVSGIRKFRNFTIRCIFRDN